MHKPIFLLIFTLLTGCEKTSLAPDRVSPKGAVPVALSEASVVDAGTHTTATLKGLHDLLQELNESVPDGKKADMLVIRIAVMQSYLALLTDALPEAKQKEIRDLANQLFKGIKERDKQEEANPKRDS